VTFDQLAAVAAPIVESTQRRLPVTVRDAAMEVAVCFEPFPNNDLIEDGSDPDILGLFVGQEYPVAGEETGPFPPQILLFLKNIWEFAEGDEAVYRDEVRLTYLHELGHYFGWSETEIQQRGLE
jgi:predicted Zn-dependent protease with MMP-like domain